jgi:hypothetical protein
MINENNDPKNLDNLSNDAVDGKNVMGGGFGDGLGDELSGPTHLEPFQAAAFVSAEDPMGGGPIGGSPSGPVGPEGPLGPLNGGPLDPNNGPLPHGPI